MSALQYLFSFKGRINRAKLWLFVLISILAQIPTIFFDEDYKEVLGQASLVPVIDKAGTGAQLAAGLFMLLVGLFLIWANLATTVKRLHDRNKSAWWLLVFWVMPWVFIVAAIASIGIPLVALGHGHAAAVASERPVTAAFAAALPWFLGFFGLAFAFMLWGFIELYCLAGSYGENRYGEDPLGGPPYCSIDKLIPGCIPRPAE